MDAGSPRIDFLLVRLVARAEELQTVLDAGNWQQAQLVQDEFDASFEQLHRIVETASVGFLPAHAPMLARLQSLQATNESLARTLRDGARVEMQRAATVSRIGGYAPMGANHQRRSEYIDGAA